ncbi:MAG TPA: hypothetical protein VFZ09_42480 [Archangium sp.]|uniref:hypothetical protein n=1 Tax=Archangium sp. TaxID=1872627 RepID=UPI002E36DE68|nr:hypothetical protein [Archangium sp.]HEX5752947.1 hypothetical protein [Archangium sp.]
MSQWTDSFTYTWYGKKPEEMGKNPGPQQSPNTCWAASAAYVLGIPEVKVKLVTDLESAIQGHLFKDYISFLHTEFPNQFKAQARLYGNDLTGADLEKRFPMIVQVPGHFIVALAIGRAQSKEDRILWWDPADGLAHNAPVSTLGTTYGGGSFLFVSKV